MSTKIKNQIKIAVEKVRQLLQYGDKDKHQQREPGRQLEAPFGVSNEAEASDDDEENASGDENDEDASGDEVPTFSYKHPLNANNDGSVRDKVISFEGVNSEETAEALLLLYYPKRKYHIILIFNI
jgi:hypothetical protein